MRNSHKMACWRGEGGEKRKRKWHVFFLSLSLTLSVFVQQERRKISDLHNAVFKPADTSMRKELTLGLFVCLFSVPGVAIRADDR